jgi:hypothetical protein
MAIDDRPFAVALSRKHGGALSRKHGGAARQPRARPDLVRVTVG